MLGSCTGITGLPESMLKKVLFSDNSRIKPRPSYLHPYSLLEFIPKILQSGKLKKK